MNLKSLSDEALLESTRDVAKNERRATNVVLHHLLEVERRRIFGPKYKSLKDYCVGELRYSDTSALRRIDAMRLLKDMPEVEEKIESGSLNLTTLAQAQTFFRAEAKVEKSLPTEAKKEVLSVLENKSSRQVDRELVGRATEPLALKKDRVRAVSDTLSELKCLVKDETLQDLDQLRGLLAHKHPSLSMGELLAIATKLALQSLDPARGPKRKVTPKMTPEQRVERATPVKARPNETDLCRAKPAPVSRYVTAEVKREVWKRAQGKCEQCKSVHRPQIDHFQLHALGGSNELKNLRLLCFHSNQREADRALGREKMEKMRRLPPPLQI